MTCGLASYAEGNSTTLDSGGRIQLKAPTWAKDGVYPGAYESKSSWFASNACDATFVVSTREDAESFYVPSAMATGAFGSPAATYRYRTCTIWVWRKNLFSLLRRGSAPATLPWVVGGG